MNEDQLEEIAIAIYEGYSRHFSKHASTWKQLRAPVRNAFRDAAKAGISIIRMIDEVNRQEEHC